MDSVTTFLMPSAVQKRPCANGRSHDTTSTRTSAMALSPCVSDAGGNLHGARRIEPAFADDTFELQRIFFEIADATGFRGAYQHALTEFRIVVREVEGRL